MAYDNNPNDPNNRDNYQLKNRLNESEDQRTRRQNNIGIVILAFVVLAFIGGYIVTTDKHGENGVETPTTAMNTAPTGTSEAAIAPASGSATTTTPATTDTVTATTATSTGNTTTTSSGTATEPATENPKVYTSEESCRSIVGGACQPVSGGWTSVNPAPDKAAVPEAVAPSMGATSPSDSSGADESAPD